MTPSPENRLTIPMAELHLHLEGALSPQLAAKLAARNGVPLPAGLTDDQGRYRWDDFTSFLNAYDAASTALRRPTDYTELACEYLSGIAGDGALYAELTISPDHSARTGISYDALVDAVAAGIGQARTATGIEARMIVTCIRHLGPQRALAIAEMAARSPHPLVTGFGMAGDERFLHAPDFRDAFHRARDAGLGATVHAGEVGGADSVREALQLPVTRIGHGVRGIEDPHVIETIVARDIVLEVCPGSNIALGVYDTMERHPLNRLRAAGVRLTLNSDDPPFFATTLRGEYNTAATAFGWGAADLLEATRTALKAAFIDDATRRALLSKTAQLSKDTGQ